MEEEEDAAMASLLLLLLSLPAVHITWRSHTEKTTQIIRNDQFIDHIGAVCGLCGAPSVSSSPSQTQPEDSPQGQYEPTACKNNTSLYNN